MEWQDPHFSYKIIFGKHNHAGGYFSYKLVWMLYSASGISAQEAAPHHDASVHHKNPKAQPLCFQILTRMDSGAFLISLVTALSSPHICQGAGTFSAASRGKSCESSWALVSHSLLPKALPAAAVPYICEVNFSLPHKHGYLPAAHIDRWFLVLC